MSNNTADVRKIDDAVKHKAEIPSEAQNDLIDQEYAKILAETKKSIRECLRAMCAKPHDHDYEKALEFRKKYCRPFDWQLRPGESAPVTVKEALKYNRRLEGCQGDKYYELYPNCCTMHKRDAHMRGVDYIIKNDSDPEPTIAGVFPKISSLVSKFRSMKKEDFLY
jgi:hypothetical protein